MAARGEVLVAIINDPLDFGIARDQHWYRIPVSSADKWLRHRWPPEWVALYQTKVFGDEAFTIRYVARVMDIRQAYRWQLFPDQPGDDRAARRYHQLVLGPLERLPRPIVSARLRRIVFIPTTWQKLTTAQEINDLFDDSPLEDRLWTELKRLRVPAERQDFVQVNRRRYALDFAVYCAMGKLDIETDGDTWHANPRRAAADNVRDNDLETAGWKLLRFTNHQVTEQMNEYCLPTIVDNLNRLGAWNDGQTAPRRLHLVDTRAEYRLGLSDRPGGR